jgi:hypothetical protein
MILAGRNQAFWAGENACSKASCTTTATGPTACHFKMRHPSQAPTKASVTVWPLVVLGASLVSAQRIFACWVGVPPSLACSALHSLATVGIRCLSLSVAVRLSHVARVTSTTADARGARSAKRSHTRQANACRRSCEGVSCSGEDGDSGSPTINARLQAHADRSTGGHQRRAARQRHHAMACCHLWVLAAGSIHETAAVPQPRARARSGCFDACAVRCAALDRVQSRGHRVGGRHLQVEARVHRGISEQGSNGQI